ncbi:preprotein translocase subunit SecA [Ructibacterium gallinarum]|uniref:Protein translocase subunit SecA n=1 Tax=Ructibacterium gallinarum TaxID=2779355 RepID=A0A9D5LZS2_9FIRM|nr:preprotein translocase subunit SecA [Ructibacterium gallinarum]MBE5041073.1 preprotein translocase subunit SecA [Ructibacterium gallinarum]
MSVKSVIEKIIGTYSDRELKKIYPIRDQVLALEDTMAAKTDAELRAMTDTLKQRLSDGETTDDILPEAFAVCREAAWRVLGMKHFPVQVVGGIVLHQGRIAEMKTGEGKTLVATLPAYLNALTGNGVHIVTVNDYLAKRDSEWMGKLYNFLGLSVGLVIHEKDNAARKQAYAADITYGTNNEMGFDYLRDNMVIYKENKVQRGHAYAIVDEVDSILIDEARTPLIISGMGDKSTDLYVQADRFAKTLKYKKVVETDSKVEVEDEDEFKDYDYIVDEKAHTAMLTPQGVKKAEEAFHIENLTDPSNMTLSHHINQAIKAIGVMKRDKDYVVKDGEVIIVDEFTGRMMFGRRYSDGLHQAIEAKEGVTVENESKTLATITFQNFFRLYKKLAGMTGTAQTEEDEFQEIYKLDVIVIPTNRPLARIDASDSIYKTELAKFNAVIDEVVAAHEKNQPVLIGTVSIEKSELLSKLLRKRGIKHNVLNAKFHDKEAEIVAQAGKAGAVTIATNMAGRGTDIVLGGNAEFMAKDEMRKQGFEEEMIVQATGFAETDDEEILAARKTYQEFYNKFKQEIEPEQEKVRQAGGLYIIGTERHESRRIDNQLRGRAGRQGDPGASKFYLSLEDDLMRLFAPERINRVMNTFGMEDDEAIESKMLSGAIETAQQRVEGRNFDIRKHVLQYDDVNNQQREMIYEQRDRVLDGEDMKNYIINMMNDTTSGIISLYVGDKQAPEEWDWEGMKDHMTTVFGTLPEETFDFSEHELDHMTQESLKEHFMEYILQKYAEKEAQFGDMMREVERILLLRVVDQKWMDHIDNMEQLRQGINLRAYAQRDPVVEYKFEAMDMFEEMIASIKEDTVRHLFHVVPQTRIERTQVAKPIAENHGDDGTVKKQPIRRKVNIGRNDPCPCGSGKKYKHCCMEKDQQQNA